MTKDIVTAELIKNTIPENINTVPINNYFDFQNITVTDNKISLDYKRNSTEYVVKSLGMTSHSAVNTALNLENSFTVAEKNDSFLKAASGILATPNALLPRTIDSLSAEIYASSQNLIFKQLKEMNRDLSNRMILISNDKNKNMAGIWFNGIGTKGELYQSGYAKADTKLYGGQVGIDKYFTDKLLLGATISASKAEADFNKYAGKAENTNVMLSGYGLYEFNKNFYTLGRIGIGYTESDVERDIWINNDNIHLKTDFLLLEEYSLKPFLSPTHTDSLYPVTKKWLFLFSLLVHKFHLFHPLMYHHNHTIQDLLSYNNLHLYYMANRI